MNVRPKRSSTLSNKSYREKKLDTDLEDPITSDDYFADPMYVTELSADTSSDDPPLPKKKPKTINRQKSQALHDLELRILQDISNKKKNAIENFNSKVEETLWKNENAYFLNKNYLKKAIDEIKNQDNKAKYFANCNRARKLKILNLCSRDPKLGSRNTGGRLTKTQQLLYQLNRCVLKHDWSAVATIIDYMLELNGKLLPVIWKSVFLVLFNHEKSNAEKIENFLQMCVGLRSAEEILKYVRELLTLPQDLSAYSKPLKTDSQDGDEEDEDDDENFDIDESILLSD